MTNHEKPEIKGWFIPRVTPYGGAPEEIKRQWVDVPLPVRYTRPEAPEVHIGHNVTNVFDVTVLGDAVSIEGVDAVKALRIFHRHEAADWWEGYLRGVGSPVLAFAIELQDQIVPNDYLRRLMPGIEDFDQIEV